MQFNGLFNCATVAELNATQLARTRHGAVLVGIKFVPHAAATLHSMPCHATQSPSCRALEIVDSCFLLLSLVTSCPAPSIRLSVSLSASLSVRSFARSFVRSYVRPSLRFANWPHFSFLSLCLQFRFDSVLWHGHFLYNPAAIISAKLQHQQQQQQQQSATAEPEFAVCVLFTSFTVTLSSVFALPSRICNKRSKH